MDIAFSIRSIRFIAFIFTFIIWLWGFYLLSSITGIAATQIRLLPMIPALPLLVAAIIFARQSGRFLSGLAFFSNKRQLLLYLGVVALTVVAIIAVNNICRIYHLLQWRFPASIFLVGLHFLGLIPVFKTWKSLLLTTLVFCLPALLVPIFVPPTYMLGALSIQLGWQFAIALICWPWFLVNDIFLLLLGARLLRGLHAQRATSVQGA